MSIDKAEGVRGKFRFNRDTGKLEQINDPKKVEVDAPFIQMDEMNEPVESMVDQSGKKFTSRSALRRHYKENGFVETGTTQVSKPDTRKFSEKYKKELDEATQKALNDLKYGMAPLSEMDKERAKNEEIEWNNYLKRMGRH